MSILKGTIIASRRRKAATDHRFEIVTEDGESLEIDVAVKEGKDPEKVARQVAWDEHELDEQDIKSIREASRKRKSHKRHRVASKRIRVARPDNVPIEASQLWDGAIRIATEKGNLLDSQGRVNYQVVNRNYRRLLASLHNLAAPKKKPK